MTTFDATKLTIRAPESSPSPSSMPIRDEFDVVNGYLKLAEIQSHQLERPSFRFP